MDSFPEWQRQQYQEDRAQLPATWHLQRGDISREQLRASCEELGLIRGGQWTAARFRCGPTELSSWLERRHGPGARGVTLPPTPADLATQPPHGEVTELLLLWGAPLRSARSVLADHEPGAARWQLDQDLRTLKRAAQDSARSGQGTHVTVLPFALRPGGLRLARQGYWLTVG